MRIGKASPVIPATRREQLLGIGKNPINFGKINVLDYTVHSGPATA